MHTSRCFYVARNIVQARDTTIDAVRDTGHAGACTREFRCELRGARCPNCRPVCGPAASKFRSVHIPVNACSVALLERAAGCRRVDAEQTAVLTSHHAKRVTIMPNDVGAGAPHPWRERVSASQQPRGSDQRTPPTGVPNGRTTQTPARRARSRYYSKCGPGMERAVQLCNASNLKSRHSMRQQRPLGVASRSTLQAHAQRHLLNTMCSRDAHTALPTRR